MTELDTLLQLGEEFARKILLEERHKFLVPTYHLIGADGSSLVIGCPWDNDTQKQLAFAAVKQKAREMKCRTFCFVSEGWSVVRLPGTDGPRPAEDPDRIEIVNISGSDGKTSKAILLHMVRDLSPGMNNRVIALEPMSHIGDAAGPMIDGIIQPQE